jgi:hypothetical protein
LRQRAAAKPSQVMNANSRTKMISAVQLMSCTSTLPNYTLSPTDRAGAEIFSFVMRGHSRSKNGIASLAYDPRIRADHWSFVPLPYH